MREQPSLQRPAAGSSDESCAQVQEDLMWGEQRKQVVWGSLPAVCTEDETQLFPPNMCLTTTFAAASSFSSANGHRFLNLLSIHSNCLDPSSTCSLPPPLPFDEGRPRDKPCFVLMRSCFSQKVRRRSHSNRLFSLEGAELRLMTAIKRDP